MPCDQTVTVTFNPAQHTFTFAPNKVFVPKKTNQTICINLRSVPNLKFTAFSITNGADFSWTVTDDQITVTDNNQDDNETSHDYTVTADYNGTTYSSDPQIVNRG